ncbi:MAG: helix-turn-helix transcriptional regulator [Anaerolineae bacterium]
MTQDRREWQRSHGGLWFLEPTLLLLLHYGPAHGYTLIDQLAAYGLEELHPSIVYRTLRDMETKDWVTSNWDTEGGQGPPRRVYRLTAVGDRILKDYVGDLEHARSCISDLVRAYHQHIEEGEGDYH